MDTVRSSRPIPLFLTALVAFFSALAALAVANGHAMAHGAEPAHAVAHGDVSSKELALRQDMRKLWEDHVTWTRLAIISLTTGAPDTEASVGRLLRNQDDIGDAVKPFYGKAAGEALSGELRSHILIAADVIAAAKAGDQAALAEAQARWTANADAIAALLNKVNPRHWKLQTMQRELHTHLALTTDEVVARLQGDWAGDVAAYDEVHVHMLHLADLLSEGIVEQFPGRFH
jgi:hypothetical protein